MQQTWIQLCTASEENSNMTQFTPTDIWKPHAVGQYNSSSQKTSVISLLVHWPLRLAG